MSPRPKTRSSEREIQSSDLETHNSELQTQNSELATRNSQPELESPPVFRQWAVLYGVVLAELAILIALFYAFTKAFE
jgi:hypothetical protein